jgi:hypothetical protein
MNSFDMWFHFFFRRNRPSGLFPFQSQCKTMDLAGSLKDSLNGGSARRKAATYTHNTNTDTFMPLVGFEPTTTLLEREKIYRALDRAATVIGIVSYWVCKFGAGVGKIF